MMDAGKPIPTDGSEPAVESAVTDSEQTIPPGEANTHGGRTNDQTIQPSGSGKGAMSDDPASSDKR